MHWELVLQGLAQEVLEGLLEVSTYRGLQVERLIERLEMLRDS
jgi:hypothetical protein